MPHQLKQDQRKCLTQPLQPLQPLQRLSGVPSCLKFFDYSIVDVVACRRALHFPERRANSQAADVSNPRLALAVD
jgi:hypothetical protein